MTRTRQHPAALLLAQGVVAAGILLIVLGLTIRLAGPWSAGFGLGLLAAWGIASVPLTNYHERIPAHGHRHNRR